MNEIINWIIGIEETASRVYEKAASLFSDDREFADFLRYLSRDEKMHHDIICKAVELITDKKGYLSVISLDNNTRQMVESYFLLVEKKMEAGTLTKEDMLDCIVSTEFSEYNDIFLYALNSLRHTSGECIPVPARMHQHRRYIERFLIKWPESRKHFERIRYLPPTWNEKILIVDDDKTTADLFETILKDEGIVEKAVNGEEGLRKVVDRYYGVIITEVDMPIMNGIEFYKKAIERYPNIKERFLFFTNSRDEQHLSFFREGNLRYILKPTLIINVKKAVIDILSKQKN